MPDDSAEIKERPGSKSGFRAKLPAAITVIARRWPTGFHCRRCGGAQSWRPTTLRFKCRACGRQTSATAGTLFERTRKPGAWFQALWCITRGKRCVDGIERKPRGVRPAKLEERGVRVMLKTRIAKAGDGFVELEGGQRIVTRLMIWAAGVKAKPAGREPAVPEGKARRNRGGPLLCGAGFCRGLGVRRLRRGSPARWRWYLRAHRSKCHARGRFGGAERCSRAVREGATAVRLPHHRRTRAGGAARRCR